MFFWTGKKKNNSNNDGRLSKHLIDYLNEVDEKYMKSFAIKSVRELQEYVSRECAVKVSQSVFGIGSRYFGVDKFRTTTWSLMCEESDILTLYKTVEFDKVRIGGAMHIGIADNYSEQWVVDYTKRSKPLVLDISACEEM